MDTPETLEKVVSPLMKLAAEETYSLRGIISTEHPTVDRALLERLIVASQEALDRQIGLLRVALEDHWSKRNSDVRPANSLQRLETLLEHTARLVHESQVLQKLKVLLFNA